MISFEMEDLIGVLQGLKPYFIAIGVLLIAAIVITAAVGKKEKKLKSLIRKETWIAVIAGIAIVVNMICFGPMNTLITLATGSGQVTAEDRGRRLRSPAERREPASSYRHRQAEPVRMGIDKPCLRRSRIRRNERTVPGREPDRRP